MSTILIIILVLLLVAEVDSQYFEADILVRPVGRDQ